MQTAIGADFWGGVNFLFWGGRISRDSTKRELVFLAGSADNSARKKEGWCVLFFFSLFFPFFGPFLVACAFPPASLLVGKKEKFTAGKSSPAQWRGCTQQRGRHDTMVTAACVSETLVQITPSVPRQRPWAPTPRQQKAIDHKVPGWYPSAG